MVTKIAAPGGPDLSQPKAPGAGGGVRGGRGWEEGGGVGVPPSRHRSCRVEVCGKLAAPSCPPPPSQRGAQGAPCAAVGPQRAEASSVVPCIRGLNRHTLGQCRVAGDAVRVLRSTLGKLRGCGPRAGRREASASRREAVAGGIPNFGGRPDRPRTHTRHASRKDRATRAHSTCLAARQPAAACPLCRVVPAARAISRCPRGRGPAALWRLRGMKPRRP